MLNGTRWEANLALGLAFLAFGWLMARFININKFSLQGMYRNRLIPRIHGRFQSLPGCERFHRVRAKRQHFDSSAGRESEAVARGQPHAEPGSRSTAGMAAAEGCVLHRDAAALRQLRTRLSSQSQIRRTRWSLSRHRYRDLRGGCQPQHGISLFAGDCVHHDSVQCPPRLLAGNPGKAGSKTWRKEGPTSAIASIVREAFSLTDGYQSVCVSLGRRPFRESRNL